MQRTTKLLVTSVVLLPLLAGCELEGGPVGIGPGDDYAVGPGYYYDEAYVGDDGYHHPRDYWYHHGNDWEHRDAVPNGFVAHDRGGLGFGHTAAYHGGGVGGGGHGGGGAEHGGGGSGGHGGR